MTISPQADKLNESELGDPESNSSTVEAATVQVTEGED